MNCNNCPYNCWGICRLSLMPVDRCVICLKDKKGK